MLRIPVLMAVCTAVILLSGLCAAENIPSRIISLAPSLTRQIYDLGGQDRLIGVTTFCPSFVKGKEVVGNLTLLNFEKICSLKPDLVLASTDCNKKNDIEKLVRLGIRVEVFEGCESFDCMCRVFVRLGGLLGRRQDAEKTLDNVRCRLDALKPEAVNGRRPRVFWQMGTTPLVTVGGKTFTNEIIGLAGCENIFGSLPGKYPRINAESVVKLNPDIIFIVDMGNEGQKQNPWQSFRQIAAVRNNRVHFLSADLVCQPTPEMFLVALKAVLERIAPVAK
ncbi:cobalamin-binding protein [bacterium]|nr:cobalamin-binding protein [bacterium]